jgi:hypothetical protein
MNSRKVLMKSSFEKAASLNLLRERVLCLLWSYSTRGINLLIVFLLHSRVYFFTTLVVLNTKLFENQLKFVNNYK